ncbi:MAG: hypothetical protein K0M70_02920 [Arenimonas sp.]|uniref:hypothetical protein n=1 Tax=Arenimonas sp. TaxID=1872635 RepID=UPI0025BF2464|nr:hypothetical protein [Arenimonas sp.]MBW8366794.1 hypothetical protein [Arenimonas sp.]
MTLQTEASTPSISDLLSKVAKLERDNLQAFNGYDASMFRSWAAAVADMIACGPQNAAPESIPETFGLIYQLIKAADELDDKERDEMRQRKAA